MTNQTYKLFLGILLLILVDLIWVSSSELTKYLYQNELFDKPFFCTYFKTSMFTLYLLILALAEPWKEACEQSSNGNYRLIDQQAGEDDSYFGSINSLSDATFVPIKTESTVSSGTESDESSMRSVRFSKLAEVREMSPHEATEALMSRLSYTASLRVRRQRNNHKTARTALVFCVLWFLANYLFQLALEPSETAMVTLLSSTSSFFTLILASIFPSSTGDRFTLSKVLAVGMNLGGVITVVISDIQGSQALKGVILSLLSAFFYACYLVLVKHKNDAGSKIDIPLFFGFVGLWNLLLMWPIFFVLNFTEIETFDLPNRQQFIVLFLNGLIGTVVSEALWLWACFLTSSLVGTIAISLQIPLSVLFDVALKGKSFPLFFYVGSLPIFLSLIIVGALLKYDDSDPLLRLLKIIYRKACNCRRQNVVRISELDEQQESLINCHDS